MKNKLIHGINYALIGSMIFGNIAPAFASEYPHMDKVQYDADDNSVAEIHETVDIEDAGTSTTNVYAELGSEFMVTVPKSLTLDGVTKLGTYTVSVEGDIAGYEKINVIPDESFTLESTGLNNVTAGIIQDKTSWLYSEFETAGNGTIDANGITAGTWNGTFNFNINLETDRNSSKITVISKNEAGEDLNASAYEITGEEKDTLLASLEDTGMIGSVDEVDALIEVESDDFEGMADTTFNVSSIAQEGDKVAILHFDETRQEWEYIGTETVDANGNINTDFSSYSPVAFVKIENGNYENIEQYTPFTLTRYNHTQAGIIGNGDVVIPETFEYDGIKYKIVSIGDSAFYNCSLLTSIEIPESVTSIGSKAFYQCSGLTSIEIPEGVTSIGGQAFFYCKNLTNVIIPNTVTSIDNNAFSGCKLINLKIPSNIQNWGIEVFSNCKDLIQVIISEGVTSIGSKAFYGCTTLSSITIPNSVTSIGINAFQNCTNLTSVKFKDTTTWYVGNSAGATTIQIDVTNTSTNAINLKTTYVGKYWTKQ